MSKGKYKRKRESAREKAKHAAEDVLLMDAEKIAEDKQEPAQKAAKKTATNKNPTRWERFKEWTKKDKTFTDWYDDVFHTHHWVKFCFPTYFRGGMEYTSRGCVLYNNTDRD